MSNIKGLILAAGKGTRLYPLTKDLPKPLVEVDGRPMIFNCINRLLQVGINNIGIVINEDHKQLFEKALEPLEAYSNVKITYIIQYRQLGIAHAIGASRSFLGFSNFICLLGDNYLFDNLAHVKLLLMENKYDAVLGIQEVENPSDYGIVVLDKDNKVFKLVEKPEQYIGNLASMGVYGFNYKIFKAIDYIRLSKRGEYEVTDAINKLLYLNGNVTYTTMKSVDLGTIERLEATDSMLKHFNK